MAFSDMRCIFCLKDSRDSRSEEHIIPYSLGNTSHVLPAGVICDHCNNYFSHGVERPFLDAPAVKLLRFYQELESRKGRLPTLSGVILPNIPTTVTRNLKTGRLSAEVPPEAYEQLSRMEKSTILLPLSGEPPSDPVISRFVAKVALEAMALKLGLNPEGLAYLCDEKQLDLLRNHARRGWPKRWPVHTRRIYDADDVSIDSHHVYGQTLHEFDFLVTKESEWYFVLAIFGLEFAINLGGPEIDGYLRWLSENRGASPLYWGKNSIHIMPTSEI